MKLADIVKVIANELGTSDVKEINKLLKDQPAVKFRIGGKSLKHLGFTGKIKSISEEGIKAYMTNRVSLIRLEEIETFEKSKSDSKWHVKSAQAKPAAKPAAATDEDDEEFDDDDIFDEEEVRPKKPKRIKEKINGKQGSRFIPTPNKK